MATARKRTQARHPGPMDRLQPCRTPGDFAYPPRSWARLTLAVLLLFGVASSAQAQLGGGRGDRQGSGQQAPEKNATPAPVTIVPEPWPRLDVGAILCKSRDDLVRYQMKMAGDPGAAAPGPAPDCRVVRKQTAIQILNRDGPSRTEVVSTDAAKQTGWTNTYLPSTPPPSSTAGSAAAK
jgi:hypothetical protein